MADMITGKLNLASFIHVKMEKKGKNGMVKGMFIPFDVNKLFVSDKGNIYFDIIAFGLKEPDENQTHLVKQSFNKADREKMSDEEQKNKPIFGNLNVRKYEQGTNNDAAEGKEYNADNEKEEDLPF